MPGTLDAADRAEEAWVHDGNLEQWLGSRAYKRLTEWSGQGHLAHKLVRTFDNGGTDAKVCVVDRRDLLEGTSQRLVLKLDRFTGSDFGTTEYARHRQAVHDSGEWADRHLARLVDPPIPVGDSWWLTFQGVAGNLDQFRVLGSLMRELYDGAEPSCIPAQLVDVYEAVISGMLSDWAGKPKIDYLSVPDLLRAHFVYRLAEGKPLRKLLDTGAEPLLMLLRDPSLTNGIELAVPVGSSHGDLHVENVLVRVQPTVVPADFRLIDLANREDRAPLGRDPIHLLVHMVNLSLRHLGTSQLTALRLVLLDPENDRRDQLPTWLRDIIARTYAAAEQWIEPSGYGPDWRRQRPLSLYAAALMVYVRRSTRPEDKPWLADLIRNAAHTFLGTVKPRAEPATVVPATRRKPVEPRPEPPGEKFVVGREAESSMFAGLVEGRAEESLLNIYGPGGIGKTEVFKKFRGNAGQHGLRFGTADVAVCGGRPSAVLRELCRTFLDGEPAEPLHGVLDLLDIHDAVWDVVRASGGVDTMFDAVGSPKAPETLQATVDCCEVALPPNLRAVLNNRFSLDRFLRSSDRDLTVLFGEALGAVMDDAPAAVLLDTYEEAGKLDPWVRQQLLPALPPQTRIVVLGRNKLARQNIDWSDHDEILSHPLSELSEDDAKSYLRHYGLTDGAALDKVYRFTGGYPLVLVLVRKLAKEVGGWQAVGELEHSADRDQIAGQLLDRILREERVHAVREVIEKCAVAAWINPEIIQALLGVGEADAREQFELVSQHSFVDRHPEGVRFHDKIRELLVERLKFTSQAEHNRLQERLLSYHSSKTSGLKPAYE
ncbi:hypothetical protein ACIA5G_42080 [Amycolatopsis sp. NPDC051758]|uniref:hypothetical protein n=1 Tax=Amycolatopsis sp. NPDC051758 TaxID=3363935 RepID=UPI00379562CF